MHKLIGTLVTAMLVVVSLGLGATPASAEPSEWGFGGYPVSANPGQLLSARLLGDAFIAPVSRVAARNAAADPAERARLAGPLIEAMNQCLADPAYSAEVLDSRGRRQSFPGLDQFTFQVDPSATTGPHWVRVSCTQSATTPPRVAVCVRFAVDSEGPRESHVTAEGEALVSDPCPGLGRLLGSLIGSWLSNAIFPRFLDAILPGFVGPVASTTTTTRAPGAPGAPAAPGGGGGAPGGGAPSGGAPGGGAPDTENPDVTSVTASGDACAGVSVSASVLDNVGVASATLSWSGSPGSGGPISMSGGGSSWSGVIPGGSLVQNGDTLQVTVNAYDAAGNSADGFDFIVIGTC